MSKDTQGIEVVFQNLRVNDFYGALVPEIWVDVDESKPLDHLLFRIMMTPGVQVGKNPVVRTPALYMMVREGIDPRWFETGLTGFEPFKCQQIGTLEVAIRLPKCPFEWLFGPFPDAETNTYAAEDREDAFLMATAGEQDTLDAIRNSLKVEDPKTWALVVGLQFKKCPTCLDYTLLDHEKRNGEVEFDYCGSGKGVSMSFRIASKPVNENENTIRKKKARKDHYKNKLEAYAARRLAFDGRTSAPYDPMDRDAQGWYF
jgi:hypothetical protein